MNVQFIETEGHRTHAIIPYDEYCKLVHAEFTEGTLPAAVVQMTILKRYTLLKAWRVHLGWKQTDLAKAVGITQGALSQMEKSHTPPHATLGRISEVLGVDVRLLTDDVE